MVSASARNESVPIQLAQCWLPVLAISNAKISFSNKIYGSNFNEPTRELSWFEITKMLIAVKKSIYCVIYCNFRPLLVHNCKVCYNGSNNQNAIWGVD